MHSLNFDTMNNTRVKGADNSNYSNETGTDADFKERIRKMGESTKNKFYQLASLFSRRKGGLVPSRDNLLGDQYAQLENDYSDSEEYGAGVKKQVQK